MFDFLKELKFRVVWNVFFFIGIVKYLYICGFSSNVDFIFFIKEKE